MSSAKLELKIESGSNSSVEITDKIINSLVLSCQQDSFTVFYNNHFTVIKNGDRLRLQDYLITLSVMTEKKEPLKKNTDSKFLSNPTPLFPKDALGFLFQSEETLPISISPPEAEAGNILKDLEIDGQNYANNNNLLIEEKKPSAWLKFRLKWKKK